MSTNNGGAPTDRVSSPVQTHLRTPRSSSPISRLQASPQGRARTGSPRSPSPLPLSILLQNKPTRTPAHRTIFLLPDGTGSGMAYMRLPPISPSICLIGLNSPLLRAPPGQKFDIAELSTRWAEEVQIRQATGPYILGGWSAGGYYAYEVAKSLMRSGQKVEKIILIDSPCRLVFEALPMEVLHYVANNNLMGSVGAATSISRPPSSTPEWLIRHFEMSLRAVAEYMPTPMNMAEPPDVFLIWAEEGVFGSEEEAAAAASITNRDLDLSVGVTRSLLLDRKHFGADGWDLLFPGARVFMAKTRGNHFSLVHPPNCGKLSSLLRAVVQQDIARGGHDDWTELEDR